jgi:aminomethyltransferase
MKKTALNEIHKKQNGKMVEFAGYEMPVQYSLGMLKEHEWTRSGNVGIFDVSHMGQYFITPSNFSLAKENQAKYTVLTNPEGGIIDDLIITKLSDNKFFIVLNAGCKEKDEAWINKNIPQSLKFTPLRDRSLIAVQGEKAEKILNEFLAQGDLADLPYMNIGFYKLKSGEEIFISRTGYTGEDGFEVSIENNIAAKFWENLSEKEEVEPIGLGARDSLRLEMGYPLYGHDLNDSTSPIEAGLGWVVSKTNENFIGAERILKEKAEGSSRKRLGVKLLERGIAREDTEISKNGEIIGKLTSGGFSPNLKTSIGQGYFDTNKIQKGDQVFAIIRGKEIKAEITSPVFIDAKTKSLKK